MSGASSGYPNVLFAVLSGTIAVHLGVKGPGGGGGGGGGGAGGTLPQPVTEGRQPEVMWLEGNPLQLGADEISQYHRREPAEP